MAACDCPGCGGRAKWLQEQRAAQEKRNADFEAWYANRQREQREQADRNAAAQDKAYADVAQSEPVG